MSAIEISCPHCGAKALVSPDDLGHDIDCPKCEESFAAPRMAKRSRPEASVNQTVSQTSAEVASSVGQTFDPRHQKGQATKKIEGLEEVLRRQRERKLKKDGESEGKLQQESGGKSKRRKSDYRETRMFGAVALIVGVMLAVGGYWLFHSDEWRTRSANPTVEEAIMWIGYGGMMIGGLVVIFSILMIVPWWMWAGFWTGFKCLLGLLVVFASVFLLVEERKLVWGSISLVGGIAYLLQQMPHLVKVVRERKELPDD